MRSIPASTYEVFEPLVADRTQLFSVRVAHNDIDFYTWGQRDCCLPRGTTSASLRDHWDYQDDQTPDKGEGYAAAQRPPDPKPTEPSIDPAKLKRTLDLQVGDVLIFEEVIGPKTGNPADADPKRRCAVRLTKVTLNEDPVIMDTVTVSGQLVPVATPVVDIEWMAEDALPFALCLSAIVPALECQYVDNISVAHGNVVLVDHGRTLQPPELIGQVPLKTTDFVCECEGEPSDIQLLADRFEPHLSKTPLTYSQPATFGLSTGQMVQQDERAAVPNIYLISIPGEIDGTQPLFTWADLNDATNLAKNILMEGWSPATYHRGIRLSKKTQQLLSEAKTPDQGHR